MNIPCKPSWRTQTVSRFSKPLYSRRIERIPYAPLRIFLQKVRQEFHNRHEHCGAREEEGQMSGMQGNQHRPAIRIVLPEDLSKELTFLTVQGDRPSVPLASGIATGIAEIDPGLSQTCSPVRRIIKTMQDKKEFIRFEERASDHPLVERVWRCHSERADRFLSVAANNFEMAITRLRGKSFLTLRGPETTATTIDCPAEGEWVCIRFKVGTFMPGFLPGSLRDHKDVTLPPATNCSFWLNGSAMEYPDFENAETFVKRLVRLGVVSRDPVVEDTLLRRTGELSLRSAQRHFLRSTGITYATFRQVERARYATNLLRDGVPIFDVVVGAGYFDQAHLTRSLGHFIGQTPSRIIEGQKQLSFLYKTNSKTEAIVIPKMARCM